MLINIYSAKCIGIEAVPVTVEVDIRAGIGIHLVGLGDIAVKESLLRTMNALQSLNYRIPGRKIIINLAPADLHKNGSCYDLAIALGILAASGQVELPALEDYMVMGELGLDGTVRSINGALPVVELAEHMGMKGCILPKVSAEEAFESSTIPIYGVGHLSDVVRILCGTENCSDLIVNLPDRRSAVPQQEADPEIMDFEDIAGQEKAKRGAEIAAAGFHNVLLVGPPGSGKSSIARAMVRILPPMTREESLQTSKIYSVAGKSCPGQGLMRSRPFRAPHYTSTSAAILGGGSTDTILPGEISLAHNGILFADEFCEASKRTIDLLREPMEKRKVTISRLHMKVEYPSKFMLVAATNPCPCGYSGEGDRCKCSESRKKAYLSKISGPILDRIDLQIRLHQVPAGDLIHGTKAEPSRIIAERVMAARSIQEKRFRNEGITTNSEMNMKQLQRYCPLDKECRAFLEKEMEQRGLSARACTRIIKLARTIADLAAVQDIRKEDLAEALSFRFSDQYWRDL